MTVLIDDRVGSRELVRMAPLKDISELTRMESADAAFLGNGPRGRILVGVELKSITDLVSSLHIGRLGARQVPRMLADYDVVWLLWYGVCRRGPRDGALQLPRGRDAWTGVKIGSKRVPWGFLVGALLTLSEAGVRVCQVRDKPEAAEWIGRLHSWWSRPWKSHKSLKVLDSRREKSLLPGAMTAEERLRANIASQLPGVEYKRGVAIARHFSSVAEMVAADEAEWGKVEGVGPVIAKAAVEALR